MLLPRILTAIVGIPLVLAAIYFGGVFYMAFVSAIILLCLYEYGLILLTAKYEALTAKVERESPDKHKIPCMITNGSILKGITYETCEVEEVLTSVPEAYVGLRIDTNELAPVYCKGDIMLFQNRFPRNGEYALFYIKEKGYIRKFVEDKDGYRLCCIHNMFEDIVLKRMDEVEYVGTCIGVVRA